MKGIHLLVTTLLFTFVACNQIMTQNTRMDKKDLVAPDAKQVPYTHEYHGDEREDMYHWMRLRDKQKNADAPDQQTKDVVAYLEAENDYTEAVLKNTEELQQTIYDEIVGRIKQTDMSVPFKDNGYYYLSRFEEGKEYPIYSRKKDNLQADEEIMLDINVLAKPYEYYDIGSRSVSPNNKILAYAEDTLSRRIYTIKFKNLETGEYLKDEIPYTTGGMVWANDDQTVFYLKKDDALRPYKVFKHKLGTDVSEDVEVYHEDDETFRAFVYKSKSKQHIIIGSYSTLSTEYRYLDANDSDGELKLFQKRERNLEYSIYSHNEFWYILHNKGAKNNMLSKTPDLENTKKSDWIPVIEHRDDVLLQSIEVFDQFLVLNERVKGITELRVIHNNKDDYYVQFDDPAHVVFPTQNRIFETDVLRFRYSSMTTPMSTYDFHMISKTKELLKRQEVVGDFNPEDYTSERRMVPARDGVEVPISIVYKKTTSIDGTAPGLLYGYGSYGASMDPYFSSVRLSLLDRGFVYVIAHIRGGQEMGRQWYDDGKLLKKKNTFNDFVDCGKYLVESDLVADDKLFAMGGSAGGLLIGAVINQAPDLWRGVVAAVPFVDVVSTMLDESIPLTTGEFDEWGNPKVKEYYDYIKSYSPYDNVVAQDYPAMLVITGYHDSQVQYWEPAKWVAKLRDYKTDDHLLLLNTNMGAGHGGASGRFRRFKETALEYAFIVDQLDR